MKPQRFAELTRELEQVMQDIAREAPAPMALALVDGVISRVRWDATPGEHEAPSDAHGSRGVLRMTVSMVVRRS